MIRQVEEHNGGEPEGSKYDEAWMKKHHPPMTTADLVKLIKDERHRIHGHQAVVESCINQLIKALTADDSEETH